MVISVAPAFMSFGKDKHSNTVRAVIMQLEQENKNDKDDVEKDAVKDKKFCDESFLDLHLFEHIVEIIETKHLHNQEHALPSQVYHPNVPTPPPNSLA
ncbi:hypothetical protein KHS38_18245 [Mucilaginibacter sp. Bleaf8]|uniref:hypothetical protein n=1 Tax=Mucilaginibacter sp. Bleaf8 TaxID=2834430 RepID=UPI001BCD92DD|nr:hypothetical protein [Mucilaginibacter sp. Bleaf8]MBS7566355.1 hypothetical protein [Mucilaginibacter sp. Bleaf8]